MKLNLNSLQEKANWQDRGFELPQYDVKEIRNNTIQNPTWVHFGAGNIFRAYQARLNQELLNRGYTDTGLIAIEGYDTEIIPKVYAPYDNLSIVVILKADGDFEKHVLGNVAEALDMQSADYQRVIEVFSKPSLQMISFSITEKGYNIKNNQGDYIAQVRKDIKEGPNKAKSYMGKISALLHKRFLEGAYPISLVSMDNISKNGSILKRNVIGIAEEWEKRDSVSRAFVNYIKDESQVSFPWTMIDKITPYPDRNIQKMLEKDGIENMDLVVTSSHTTTAPYVNTEELEYLVIEDNFPNGRPPLEKVGVIFTDQETVHKVETMKVTTCLNPLHTSLAIFGSLLGFTSISEEMKDQDLRGFVTKMAYEEALPVVEDPKIIDPKVFLEEVLLRFSNPYIPDTPQRIATDTSQLMAIRFGKTIQSYVEREDKDVRTLDFIPLVIAGWCRYLMGVDDNGNVFDISPDPLLNDLRPHLKNLKVGNKGNVTEQLRPILSRSEIFGVDLYKIGLNITIEKHFEKMIKEYGAVRKTIQSVLTES